MTVKPLILIVCLVVLGTAAPGQNDAWRTLVPLESDRLGVEKVLGRPESYFKNFGTYKATFGKFSVWYSNGGCGKGSKEVQYNVPSGKLIGFIVYVSKPLVLEKYVPDIGHYAKSESPFKDGKYLYSSPDGSTLYETILSGDSQELIYSISVEPGKFKKRLLCKAN